MNVLDTLGLKCPQPVLKLAVLAVNLEAGEMVEVLGDCPTFEKDMRTWCTRLKKTLISVVCEEGQVKRIQIML